MFFCALVNQFCFCIWSLCQNLPLGGEFPFKFQDHKKKIDAHPIRHVYSQQVKPQEEPNGAHAPTICNGGDAEFRLEELHFLHFDETSRGDLERDVLLMYKKQDLAMEKGELAGFFQGLIEVNYYQLLEKFRRPTSSESIFFWGVPFKGSCFDPMFHLADKKSQLLWGRNATSVGWMAMDVEGCRSCPWK